MKDIENRESDHVANALERLHVALVRLERAAAKRTSDAAGETADLRQEAETLRRRYESLRISAGQVAERLDAAVGRVAALMDKSG